MKEKDMFNLAKLLLEEPAKLERFFILFLKLLISLLIATSLFGYNLSFSEVIQNLIPKDYSISSLALFIFVIIVIWIIVWHIVSEKILCDFLIGRLSKIGKENFSINPLVFFKVLKGEKENLSPDKNIFIFYNILQTYSKVGKKIIYDSKSRTQQYFSIATIAYSTLLFFPGDAIIPLWLKWFGPFLIVYLFISSFILHKANNYISNNLVEMKKAIKTLVYAQLVIKSIDKNSFITTHYNRSGSWPQIILVKKSNVDWLPNKIEFKPINYWNDLLSKEILNNILQKQFEKHTNSNEKINHYKVLVCNLELDPQNIWQILAQPNFIYLHCLNEEQILKNLDVLLYKISNGNYPDKNL